MKKPSISFASLRHSTAVGMLLLLSSCTVMLPVASGNGKTGGSKTGKAQAMSIFGIWITPDASIKTAADNGGITAIATVDTKVSNYLGIVHIYETTVSGD